MHTTRITWLAILLGGLAACDSGSSSAENQPDGASDRGILDQGMVEDAAVDSAIADATMEPDAELPPDARVEPLGPLSLNSLIPNRGLSNGGTAVRVVGTGFGAGIQLTIGGQPCGDLVVESENLLRCTTPPGPVGTAEVFASLEVTPADRRQARLIDGFTWYEAVMVTQVRPDRIPVRGGVQVELRGSGLIENTRVTIGGQPVAEVERLPAGSLLVTAPPGTAGPADVTVANFNGQHTLAGGLFYFEEVQVDGIDPPVGPMAGGTAVALHGVGLVEATRVMFGDGAAEVQSAAADRTRLDVNTPPVAAPGPVTVAVSNENGEFSVPAGFVYFDGGRNDFSVAGVAPPAGPVAGGNPVFVAGSGFTNRTEVDFDGRPLPCELLDAHRLRCTAPPAFAGPVDVRVTDGANSAVVAEGYTYFETLELIAVQPDRGSIAGGTLVTLTGFGFVDDMQVRLGELELIDVTLVDETTLVGTSPANTPGPVDVRINTEFSRATIPGGYRYFDPITRFGGVWGEPIDGAVNVTVLNASSGQPEAEATVLLVAEDGDLTLEGLSNAQGQLTLSAAGLEGPAKITAAKEGFEVTTIEDVEAENVTIYLLPNDGDGPPPPGVPAAILRGVATGLDLLPKPIEERYVNVIFIETSHFTPYDRNRMPPPGPGGLLFEDGPYEIIARPGELAVVATAAEIDRDVLKDFQDGLIEYWDMRTAIRPLSMGLRRFVSASPGQEIDDLDVVIDHRMDMVLPVDLDNPPLGMAPGPQYYAVLPRLNLGAEGFWEIDTQAVNVEPSLSVRQMPRLDGWDADIEYYLISLAFSDTADNTPMSINIEQVRDVAAGVFATPFVGSPFFINPGIGGNLGLDRHVTWGVSDGYDGPIRRPSANLVTIEEPALGPPKPLWRYVTPSLVTEFDVPVLPESAGAAGLGRGLMILNIIPFIIDGNFNFDDFTYDELSQFRWKSWGVASTTFRP